MSINSLYIKLLSYVKSRIQGRIEAENTAIQNTAEAMKAAQKLRTERCADAERLALELKETAGKQLEKTLDKEQAKREAHKAELDSLISALS